MNILFEDEQILVSVKPPHLNSEFTPKKDGYPDLLQEYVHGYISVVHRLDMGVGGVMVYAKTQKAAAILCSDLQNRKITKEYLAVAHGSLAPGGTLTDLLFYDRIKGKSFVVDRKRAGVKEAVLHYETEKEIALFGSPLSLLKVRLETGRTHQIRVQFASRSHPLFGDRKYGATEPPPIGLFCRRLVFSHPVTKKEMEFTALPEGEPWNLFFNV